MLGGRPGAALTAFATGQLSVVDTAVATRHTRPMNAEHRRIVLEARDQLVASGVVADAVEARLEAEVLLGHVLGLDRAALYAGYDHLADSSTVAAFRTLLSRRLGGEPVAYIVGTREFYGLTFRVGPGVLIPRPETELLVERALAAAIQLSLPAIADVGCGSGCVGIALAVHLPRALVWAIDLSEEALRITQENAVRLGVGSRVTAIQGDLLGPLPAPVDVIVANLPYVNARDLADLPASIAHFEPFLALDGGASGLDQIRRLIDQSPFYLRPGGSLLLEVGYDQAAAVAGSLRRRFPGAGIQSWRDLGGHVRVAGVRLPSLDDGGPQASR
jgi:release factor glutamine methyltransferase